jgi:ribosomal protein L7/L12
VGVKFVEYGILTLMFISVILLYIKITELKKQVKSQQIQIDNLCKETGNQQLATYFISDEEKEYIVHLKNSGKKVEAVKKLREVTSMDLVQAKKYIDAL